MWATHLWFISKAGYARNSNMSLDEKAAAQSTLVRKAKTLHHLPDNLKKKQKLYRFLCSGGISPAIVFEVLNTVFTDPPSDQSDSFSEFPLTYWYVRQPSPIEKPLQKRGDALLKKIALFPLLFFEEKGCGSVLVVGEGEN